VTGPGTVYVVGAGLAGLAAAVELADAGCHVVLSESAGHAGGRCRSLYDDALNRIIDNGNHLILSGNVAVAAYLGQIGSRDALVGPDKAIYPFLDLKTGCRWSFQPGGGPLPLWLLAPSRRVPGTGLIDYLSAVKLAWAGPDSCVTDCLNSGSLLFSRLWEPMALSILNTQPVEGAASLLWRVLAETFGRGEVACRPRLARQGLGPALVDPAIAHLRHRDVSISFNARLRSIEFSDDQAVCLDFVNGKIKLGWDDAVILAVPALVSMDILPDITAPRETRAILNAHFCLDGPPQPLGLLGLVGGMSQWLFTRGDVASVTVSAADSLMEQSADALAGQLWPEVCQALNLGVRPLPAHRMVKERRATFAQTPAEVRRRPPTRTAWRNIFLAGDWTDTGLPATIEGAIRSGQAAASAALNGNITKS
jgi:squalene-associated FAD-dependent desaturase